ncbi:hypothetical protein [Streptomyces lasiicapitis]|uniref:hypothetical protein n=1 Tax=Streptomyces lasiicapitis TaxID=1923961 RepID=UPI00364A5B38
MTDIRTEPLPPGGRLRACWVAAHAPAAGVPRWARLAALAVPLTALPSCVWRIAAWFLDDGTHDMQGDLPAWMPGWFYVVLLSVVSELFAFTAVGLVARWGEVFPRWVPFLRGRGVRPLAAVVPAALGAVAVTVLWTAAFISEARGVTITGEELSDDYPTRQGAWEAAALYVSYAPLLLWGPLLGAVTWAYWRRRRTPR